MDFENVPVLWKAEDSAARVEVVGRFLSASTMEAYEQLSEDYPVLFGFNRPWRQTPDTVAQVCELLRRAEQIFALYKTGDTDLNEMMRCGIVPVSVGWRDDDTPFFELKDATFSLDFMYAVKSPEYAAWLKVASEKVKTRLGGFGYTMEFGRGALHYVRELEGVDVLAQPKDDCSLILQQLFNIHLADVATVTTAPSMNPVNIPYSGISLLWLGLSERLSAGRPFRCEACGKPMVAYAERRKREYCCDACRKWASAHPGQKRGYWYVEKR